MIFQIVLTAAFTGLIIYAYRQRRLLVASITIIVLAIMGIAFTFFPQITVILANTMGIGRGTDLIFYLYIVFSIAVGFRLFIALKELEAKLAILARRIAIAETIDAND